MFLHNTTAIKKCEFKREVILATAATVEVVIISVAT